MKRTLQHDFRKVINYVMMDSWNRVPGGPQEPDFVASLVLAGTPQFHRVITATRGIWNKVNTVGVFCHQSPMVKYLDGADERRCELGDVLWCHFHTDIRGRTFRNALLLQSKVSGSEFQTIPYTDTQLKLYREWPQYEYYRSGILNGQIRNLLPKQPHAGAQYMFIDNRPLTDIGVGVFGSSHHYAFPIGTTTITPILRGDTPLELELVRFLFWGSGRPFGSTSEAAKEVWTHIVWDLLRNGMRKAFNRRRAGFNNSPRISRSKTQMDGMLAFYGSTIDIRPVFGEEFYNEFETLFSSSDGGNTNEEYRPNEKDDGGAPSIIIFITTESKGG